MERRERFPYLSARKSRSFRVQAAHGQVFDRKRSAVREHLAPYPFDVQFADIRGTGGEGVRAFQRDEILRNVRVLREEEPEFAVRHIPFEVDHMPPDELRRALRPALRHPEREQATESEFRPHRFMPVHIALRVVRGALADVVQERRPSDRGRRHRKREVGVPARVKDVILLGLFEPAERGKLRDEQLRETERVHEREPPDVPVRVAERGISGVRGGDPV